MCMTDYELFYFTYMIEHSIVYFSQITAHKHINVDFSKNAQSSDGVLLGYMVGKGKFTSLEVANKIINQNYPEALTVLLRERGWLVVNFVESSMMNVSLGQMVNTLNEKCWKSVMKNELHRHETLLHN